jgi:hypothetical protein
MFTMIKARCSTGWSQAFSNALRSRANETHGSSDRTALLAPIGNVAICF